jgi:hypothetical protein
MAAAPVVATGPSQDVSQQTRNSNKLEDQAATAALCATKSDNASTTGREYLDNDNKLSTAGERPTPECAEAC